MDHYGYKGIIEDDIEQGPREPEDEPWYPCDPENSLDAEMEGVVVKSQLEQQIKICYGMVSRFFFHCDLYWNKPRAQNRKFSHVGRSTKSESKCFHKHLSSCLVSE